MSQANVEYFGGLEQANAGYGHFNELLENSKDNEYMSERNNLKMKLTNFHTLTDTAEPTSKVAALVLQERIQEGTYQQPELEPLKILHEYLIEKHPTPNAGEALTETFGKMKVLTPEVFDLVEKSTLLGNIPSTELALANADYWITVRHYGDCVFVEEGDDCNKYLEEAEELSLKKSSNDDASDATFDESLLPASPDAYSHIDYLAEVYTRDCQRAGQECSYFEKRGSANGYKSVTYLGTDHVTGKYVVAYMETRPTNSDAYYTVAFSEHWPGGDYRSALDTENSADPARAIQQFQIGNSYTATVTYERGPGLSATH